MSVKRNLAQEAALILNIADPWKKVEASLALAKDWRYGFLAFERRVPLPDRPARPEYPLLLAPRAMKRRNAGGNAEKRLALLHALAHIELNAIDLAWDMLARFGEADFPLAFFEDWIKVGEEEAIHFQLITERLEELGIKYGDLPAHDGLWEAALGTSHDIVARLAIVPLIFEARGLDVTPATIDRFREVGDDRSADILMRIYQDEIGHVRIGHHWYQYFTREMADPITYWHELKERHFRGTLKPPFNEEARLEAGFSREYWNA